MWHVRQRVLREPHFSTFGRLTSEYLVDMCTRNFENTLRFIRRSQLEMARSTAALMGEDFVPENQNIYLPASFIGSRRWASEQVSDALAIAAAYGAPSFFITVTCNPDWDEVRQVLRPGQHWMDHPTAVVRVFHAKMKRFYEVC